MVATGFSRDKCESAGQGVGKSEFLLLMETLKIHLFSHLQCEGVGVGTHQLPPTAPAEPGPPSDACFSSWSLWSHTMLTLASFTDC